MNGIERRINQSARTERLLTLMLNHLLEEATIADLQTEMQSGKYTARWITEKYLGRIESTNKKDPALFAVLETNPEALAIADQLDAERKSKGLRGPLHETPVLALPATVMRNF